MRMEAKSMTDAIFLCFMECSLLAIKTRLTSYFNGSTRVTLRYNNCFYYRKLEKVGGGGGGG